MEEHLKLIGTMSGNVIMDQDNIFEYTLGLACG
jgi:hypothetical protein